MTFLKTTVSILCLIGLGISGCADRAVVSSTPDEPEILTIHADGTMEFRNRILPEEDVVIYSDVGGSEKAAIRIRMEPLHPDYYRDTIIVDRIRRITDESVVPDSD